MLKYLALLFNTVALLIYQFFFADGITVTQNIPATAKAESEFIVELTINKGSIGGFAKLQQDLPEGFTAVQDDNNGASFTFSNQSVKFIWMSLPSDKEFKVKYKVKVAAGVSGAKTIAGKFSCVSDNVKQSVDIAPATINIGEDATAPVVATPAPPATTEPVATENTPAAVAKDVTTTSTPATTEPAASSSTQESSTITCTRVVPDKAGADFTVEITINKGNITGFAKLLETLPAGFTATAMESQNGSFSFADQKVKFVWVSMPSKPEFKISYKVSVIPSVTGSQPISGVFSYIENDETKKYTLQTSTVAVNSAEITQPVVTNPPVTTPTNTVTLTQPVVATQTKTQSDDNTTSASNNKSLSATTIPSPQGIVNYKVQIAALHNAVSTSKLSSLYKLSDKINTEMSEGFTKYTVGSHSEYRSARDAREEIKNKGVVGPFVTAYNSGKRITVQEALMITSQKWFR